MCHLPLELVWTVRGEGAGQRQTCVCSDVRTAMLEHAEEVL